MQCLLLIKLSHTPFAQLPQFPLVLNENMAQNTGKLILCQESNLQPCVAAPSQTESFSATMIHTATQRQLNPFYTLYMPHTLYMPPCKASIFTVRQECSRKGACISMRRLDTCLQRQAVHRPRPHWINWLNMFSCLSIMSHSGLNTLIVHCYTSRSITAKYHMKPLLGSTNSTAFTAPCNLESLLNAGALMLQDNYINFLDSNLVCFIHYMVLFHSPETVSCLVRSTMTHLQTWPSLIYMQCMIMTVCRKCVGDNILQPET